MISFDSKSFIENSNTRSHTIGSGNNRALVVHIIRNTYSSIPGPVTVTFNGVPMTQVLNDGIVGGVSNGAIRMQTFIMLNPPVGTYNIVSSQSVNLISASSYFNVDQTNPIQSSNIIKGASYTGKSVDVTFIKDGYLIGCVAVLGYITGVSGTSLNYANDGFQKNDSYQEVTIGNRSFSAGWYTNNQFDQVYMLSAIALAPVIPEPTVATSAVNNIEGVQARGNGNIIDVGTAAVTERGFVWSTSSHAKPSIATAPASSGYEGYNSESGSYSAGAFNKLLTGLAKGQTYYVRAWAHNANGYGYGAEVTFTTIALPTVEISSIDQILFNSFRIFANITDSDEQTVIARGFVYGTESLSNPGDVSPEDSGYEVVTKNTGVFDLGEYIKIIKNLVGATTYYIRAYTQSTNGYAYSDEEEVLTETPIPVIESIDPPGVGLGVSREITIIGNYFMDDAVVMFGEEEATNVVVSEYGTSITCDCPESAVQKEVVLKVINDDDQEATAAFFYMEEIPPIPQPDPIVASFSIEAVSYVS